MARPGITDKEATLQYLFDRPSEPVFYPKGNELASFEVPDDYLVERFRPVREGIFNRIGDNVGPKINVRRIQVPDITPSMKLGRREQFSNFIPDHRKQAAHLIKVFMGMRDVNDFVSACVYCRDRVNPFMFVYAMSVAMLHREDTKNFPLPNTLCEMFPEKFMDSAILRQAREEANILDEGDRMPLEIPRDYTASDIEPEHRVAYFREDLGINLHHWHWHLVYPIDGNRSIVNKDRRGELFYYMHQQVMARYNFERLCNDLARVERLVNFRDPIPEGYFPKLDSLVSSRVWPSRHANASLSNVIRENQNVRIDLDDLERWRDRLLDAIAQGAYIDNSGNRVDLDLTTGIDVLGNLMESSILSPNRNYYGDFHNFGHVAIALCHDPDSRHLETFSVMGDPATAMRDPAFYRWHAFVDYIFQVYKGTLPPYTTQELDFPGVRVTAIEVQSGKRPKNEIGTFWKQNDVDLSRGLDFTPRGSVFARFTHLDHQPFTYKINIQSDQARVGTARIFLAPKFDERGVPWSLRDHRNMFIELDRFRVNLKPRDNIIERRSNQSSLTIPFEQTFRNLDQARPTQGKPLENFNFCGCGWPQHMLVPKGAAEGFQCQLFVMISNIEGDRVDDSGNSGGNSGSGTGRGECDDASVFCGVRDKKYPDRRPMGFPFDRPPREGVDVLSQFMTRNMNVADVKIVFSNRVDTPRRGNNDNAG